MPDPIPTDDLYARLGVSPDADTATIDRAWRGLLKRHHPDIAGSLSLELAKLINVAHDWLSQPARRARYDASAGVRAAGEWGTVGWGTPGGRASRQQARPGQATPPRPSPRRAGPAPEARRWTPPDDLDEVFGASAPAVRSFLARAATLDADDVDRLSVSEPEGLADAMRNLVPPDLWARIEAIDERLAAVLDRRARRDPAAFAAARSYGRAVVLELFLWFYLADAEPMLERLRRAWESAVGLPRYGPNTTQVADLIGRLARSTPEQARALAAAWDEVPGTRLPWPADAWEFDFAAFEVSTALARRDAERAVPRWRGATEGELERAAAAFASTAHVVTLRPIFTPRAYARYAPAWHALGGPTIGGPALGTSLEDRRARPTVRRT